MPCSFLLDDKQLASISQLISVKLCCFEAKALSIRKHGMCRAYASDCRIVFKRSDQLLSLIDIKCSWFETNEYLDTKILSFSDVEEYGALTKTDMPNSVWLSDETVSGIDIYTRSYSRNNESAAYDSFIVLKTDKNNDILLGTDEDISDNLFLAQVSEAQLLRYIEEQKETKFSEYAIDIHRRVHLG